jgi:hypothetical protein
LQIPQWEGFELTSMQVPSQSTLGAGHWQVLATQTRPTAQATLQAPQWAAFEVVSTQSVPHSTVPAGQPTALQTPAAQTCPVGQMTPQVPQLAESACVSTQTPLQIVWPGWHWHCP